MMTDITLHSPLSDALAKVRRFYSDREGTGLNLSPEAVGAMASALATMELIALELESDVARHRLMDAARLERRREVRSAIAAAVGDGSVQLLPIVPRPTAGVPV